MAVRSAQLQDLAYVPSYNTLDTNLVNHVSNQVQQQSSRARQYGSDIQQDLQEQVLSTTTGLPEEFQSEAIGLVDESMRNIDNIFEQRGARGSMPAIQREAQSIQRRLQPYQQAAQQYQQYQQRINEAEKVDPSVRRWAKQQGQVVRGEDGRLTFQGIPTEAFDNWQNLEEVTKDFLSQAEASTYESGLQPSATFPEQYMERVTQEVLGKNKLKMAGVANLLNNDQYRSQLEYQLVSQGINPDETVETVVQPRQVSENGEVLQEEQKIKTSALHKRAMEVVDPSASLKAYSKQNFTDTKTNLEAQRLIDDSMPSLSNTIRMGVPEGNFGTPAKLNEGFTEKTQVLEQLNTALQSTDNEYERASIQDKINQIEAERGGLIRHQERALNEAGIRSQDIHSAIANLDQQLLDQKISPKSSFLGAASTPAFRTELHNNTINDSYRDLYEKYQETGILDPKFEQFLQNKTNLDFDTYENILEESSKAFATNTTLTGFTSKQLSDVFTRQGSMMLNAGGQGDSAVDLQRIHSDPSKAKSIYETDFHEEVAEIEAGGYYVDPQTSELRVAYKAFDGEGKPLGLVGAKAPTGMFNYLRPEDQHQLQSYQSSMIDVAMRAPGKEVTIDHPVFSEGQRIGDTKVTIRSRLAQNEDGTVSTKDTFGEQFVVIFRDENGNKKEVPAKSKGEALEYLDALSKNNIDAINQRFGIK